MAPGGEPVTPPAVEAIQVWMLRMVTHPDGVEAGFSAARAEGLLPESVERTEDLVTPGPQQSATERLHVYAYAYFARLLDILEAEYPATLALLGDRGREALKAFLVEHPSRAYTLGRLSLGFPQWLAAREGALAGDVARVERALEEVIDAVAEAPLPHAALAAIPMEEWGDLPLRPTSSLMLFPLTRRVGPLMNALQRGEPVVAPPPSPTPVYGCVHRQGFSPWRRDLDGVQYALLAALQGGATLGEALEAALAVEDADPESLLGSLGGWFEDWMGDGLFVGLSEAAGAHQAEREIFEPGDEQQAH